MHAINGKLCFYLKNICNKCDRKGTNEEEKCTKLFPFSQECWFESSPKHDVQADTNKTHHVLTMQSDTLYLAASA